MPKRNRTWLGLTPEEWAVRIIAMGLLIWVVVLIGRLDTEAKHKAGLFDVIFEQQKTIDMWRDAACDAFEGTARHQQRRGLTTLEEFTARMATIDSLRGEIEP